MGRRSFSLLTVTTITLIFLISIIAGVAGSLLGLGGGIIIIPALTLIWGIDIRYAIGASAVAVIATSSSAAAAYIREGLTNIRIGMFLEIAAIPGAIAGAFLTGLINPRFLYILFACVLGYSVFILFRRRHLELPECTDPTPLANSLRLAGCYYDHSLKQTISYAPAGLCPSFLSMLGAGLLSGLLGIGNGAINVMVMDLLMKLPMKVATATSNFMIGITIAASAGIYFAHGYINPIIAAPVALGVVLGSMLGARFMIRLKNTTVRKIFLPVLFYIALQMLLRGIRG